MAAMIDYINRSAQKHIVTLENPIEFLHRDVSCSLTQREVGTDTESFRSGLRAALRQDPDVILIGEMRDPETVDTAMKAAETGHLLISTLHTPDATTTVSRIVAMFPPEEQDIVRVRLADALHAVVSQRLLRRKDGHGRVAALEVMTVTSTIRDLILDQNRTAEIREFIADGREQYGMQTFDQHLMDLVQADEVSYEAAVANASNPSDFELQMRTFRRKSKLSTARPAAAAPTAPAPQPPEGSGPEGLMTDFSSLLP
jgi:twitching motility protein PilT